MRGETPPPIYVVIVPNRVWDIMARASHCEYIVTHQKEQVDERNAPERRAPHWSVPLLLNMTLSDDNADDTQKVER